MGITFAIIFELGHESGKEKKQRKEVDRERREWCE